MGFYPGKINEVFGSPIRAGAIQCASAEGKSVAFECGTLLRISLRIGLEGRIEEAKFKTNGCGYAIAAAEVVAAWLKGLELTELHGLAREDILQYLQTRLGDFPSARLHCAELAVTAVKAAFADYRARRVEEFQGEKALICTCFGVSEETIEVLIGEGKATGVSEIAAMTRAGTGCGSCRMLIQELLDAAGHN